MVDANQGWRMPGDLTPRWDLDTALAFARELERLDAYWLEEPLPTEDVDGYAALRRRSTAPARRGRVRAVGGGGARARPARGGIDVVQTDVVLVGGIEGARRIAAVARGARALVEPAHVVERLRAAREPPRRARVLDVPVPRGAVRPAGVVGRSGATGCCP